jgi:hypothetical protein
MNRRKKALQHRSQSPAYRQAFERLDAALEENTPSNNYEKIRLMRLAMFADVDEYMKTHPLNLPKP